MKKNQPKSVKRVLGLDRSGPPPPETRGDQPLNIWTIPNAVGFIRLALIPLFLVLALTSNNHPSALSVVIFAIAAGSDYLDGFLARITGQYSRFGTLLDPLTDRLLIISAVIVCWDFNLLPRWALAVLIARELLMVVLARIGLSFGLQLKINWPGRIAVFPVMGSLFFAMATLTVVGEILLYIGLALAILATGMYVRDGFVELKGKKKG